MNESRSERLDQMVQKGSFRPFDLQLALHRDQHVYNAQRFVEESIYRFGQNLPAPTRYLLQNGPMGHLVKYEYQRRSESKFASYGGLMNKVRSSRYLLPDKQYDAGLREQCRRELEGDYTPVTREWIMKRPTVSKKEAQRVRNQEYRRRRRESLESSRTSNNSRKVLLFLLNKNKIFFFV